MNFILFDSSVRNSLLPFTFTRPVADIRIGILSIREKWEKYLGFTTTTITEEYLEAKYPMVELEENVLINASYLPTKSLVEQVTNLSKNQAIFNGEEVIAFFTSDSQEDVDFKLYDQIEFRDELMKSIDTFKRPLEKEKNIIDSDCDEDLPEDAEETEWEIKAEQPLVQSWTYTVMARSACEAIKKIEEGEEDGVTHNDDNEYYDYGDIEYEAI